MHVEFLLEERSAEEVLKSILPKIISDDVSFSCHIFEGKDDLLKQLPMRLKGYRLWIPDDYRIIVLVDEDRDNCFQLKEQLEKSAREAGFMTKSSARPTDNFRVVNRLAIEEIGGMVFW